MDVAENVHIRGGFFTVVWGGKREYIRTYNVRISREKRQYCCSRVVGPGNEENERGSEKIYREAV